MTELNSNVFYAVRPELVLNAAKHFDVRASILDGGARSLYNKAVALNSGKAPGRWGKHQRAVIKQFCEYTIISGSDALLPWQELVEDEHHYDGKEGIAARTGNRPLTTVRRVGVNVDALKRARFERSLELEEVATGSGLPLRLLQAIEGGQWHDVAVSTAEAIAAVLEMPAESIFTYFDHPGIDDNAGLAMAADSAENSTFIERLKPYRKAFIAGGFAVIFLLGALIWPDLSNKWKAVTNVQNFTSTQWRMSVELVNHNIPIPEETINLWRNGGYLQLRENGVVAFNWVDPSALVELPQTEVLWNQQGNRMTLTLDEIIYPFEIGDDHETLITFDSTRSFEMTLHKIAK